MHDPARQVRPAVHSKMDISARLVAGWARVIARHGKCVFAAAGFELRPVGLCAANDMATISDLSRLMTQWVEALADGVRDHRETLALADSIRPLVQALNAIVGEADRVRGVA